MLRWNCFAGLSAIATIALLATACGDDTADGASSSASDTATSGASGAANTDPSNDDSNEVSTSANDDGPPDETLGDTDTDTSDSEWDTDGSGTSEIASACGDIDCGQNGYCELNDAGQPMCACDGGFASIGMTCVACRQVQNEYSPNVVTTLATVSPLISGAPPPPSHNNDANLVLRSLDSGDEVWLGNTHSQELTQSVIPGRYELYYEFESGGELVPVNRHARIGIFEIDNLEPLKVDIPVATVDVRVTLNGATPPSDPQRFGEVYLVNDSTGDEALLVNTVEADGVANIIPGEYDVHYRVIKPGAGIPANTDTKVAAVSIGFPGEVIQALDIDIPMVSIAGSIQVSGTTPPDDSQDFGRIELVDQATSAVTQVAETLDGDYDIDLVAGAGQQLVYRAVQPGASVPENTAAVLDEDFDVSGGGNRGINIPAVRIQGDITVNDALPSPDGSEDGRILLRNPDSGDEVLIGTTLAGTYDALVIAGSYDAHYSQVASTDTLPVNTDAFLREFVAEEAGTINVPVVAVSSTITVDGSPPPDVAYDDGLVYLRSPVTGDTALLGNTRQGGFDALIVPGEYEVIYSAELSEGAVPLNKLAIVSALAPWGSDDNTGYPIDVPFRTVTGAITLDRQVPDATPGTGSLFLEAIGTADHVFLGHTGSPMFDRALSYGRYLVRYRAAPAASGGLSDELPANTNAGIACIELGKL